MLQTVSGTSSDLQAVRESTTSSGGCKSSPSVCEGGSGFPARHLEILREHWLELKQRLTPSRVVHALFHRKIMSQEELEDFVEVKESRNSTATKLLMLMQTRSCHHFVVFAEVLSETIGIEDLGRKLLQEAKSTDDDVTALVKELQMKLELKEQEVMQLRGNACRPCAECHSLRKAVVAESLIADAVHQASPDLLKQGSRYVSSYKWKFGTNLPHCGMFFNRFVVSEKRAIASDWHKNQVYVTDLCSEPLRWVTKSNTHDAGRLYRLFTVGNKCYGTFYKEDSIQEQTIASYNIDKNEWTKVADLPSNTALQWYGIVGDSNRIYVVGGWDAAWSALNTIFVYDAQTGLLCGKKTLMSSRRSCACAIVNKMLYVAGGFCGTKGLKQVEGFSLNDFSCHKLASTETYRCSMAALCGQLVTSGGTTESGDYSPCSNAVSVFDPSINVWLPSAPMNSRRLFHGMYAHEDDGTLSVVGGDDCVNGLLHDLNSVEHLKIIAV